MKKHNGSDEGFEGSISQIKGVANFLKKHDIGLSVYQSLKGDKNTMQDVKKIY